MRQVVCLMKNEQQSQNLLLKVDPHSTFRNNFLQPATNVFVALKAAKYEIQKPSRNIVSLQVFVDVSRFSPCVINLSRNKNICCGLKKVVAESRAQVYFEQQILALLITPDEKRETSTKTCNETMLRDKLRVFVSRISPPYTNTILNNQRACFLRTVF